MQVMFNKVVAELEKAYGDGMKTNFQLIEIASHVFPQLKQNVFRNADYDFDQMINRFAIVNTDNRKGVHWTATYQTGRTIYLFDSFGRSTKNLIPVFYKRAKKAGYMIIDTRHRREQKDYQQDCGLRSLAWIIIASSRGIQQALKI